jgi:tripartite-type tricarboxylate transporter receptor subunit TctC
MKEIQAKRANGTETTIGLLVLGKCDDAFGGHNMKLPRRTFLKFAGAAVAAPAFTRVATAQAYPSRSITMVVSAAAGGPVDVAARIIAERMGTSLGQSIIIENVGGADGSIGVGRVARARPDGYTISHGIMSQQVLNGAFYSLPYDVLNDFAPIAPLAKASLILVGRKDLSAKDLHELVVWLKANPNKVSAAVATVGVRLLEMNFQKETGTKFTLVPYRGSAPAMQDLLAGQIDLLVDGLRTSLPLVRAGSIRPFAVTSDKRLAVAPDIPTFAEMGFPALSYSEWTALFAPRGTPSDVIGKLNAAAVEALADPKVRTRLGEFGNEIFPHDQQRPENLGALVKADAEKWWPLIKEFGIGAE